MCFLTAFPFSGPWYCSCTSKSCSSMSQVSSISGSLKLTAILCKTKHAAMMVQTLSGVILISEWRIWNLRLTRPKVRSMRQRVVLWAPLKRSSDLVWGWAYGVWRNGVQAYPLSPRSTPSSSPWLLPSSCRPMAEVLKMWLSWALPGHLATTFVNNPAKYNFKSYF